MKSNLNFYAIAISLIRIDDSHPALILGVICEPEEDEYAIVSPINEKRMFQEFFQGLINELSGRRFSKPPKAGPRYWCTFRPENSTAFSYAVVFVRRGRQARTEIYIDSPDRNRNKQIFDALYSEKEEIESALNTELSWERLDDRRACRVAIYRPGSIDDPPEELEEIKKWAIENLERFKKVFPSRIEAA